MAERIGANVYRLPSPPTKGRPVCSQCGKELPTMSDISMFMPPSTLGEFEFVEALLLFEVRCPCGTTMVLKKRAAL